jgi:glutathione synthase/RimK-type ligase-like ATP-grasp enzyme
MKYWVTTNGRPSESADVLSKQDNFGRAFKGGRVKAGEIVINWGSSQAPEFSLAGVTLLNQPAAVGAASNKLKAFEKFKEAQIPTPEWTTDKAVAASWDHTLFARTKLTGHSGEGIVVCPKGEDIVDAPLYTYYIFKEREYRVHVVREAVIDVQRKIKDPQRVPTSWKIRSHENGFIFARNGVDSDEKRDKIAVAAIKALGLDFGAVDMIADNFGNYYVLEVNTAPGLEGQTVDNYAYGFRNCL